MICPKCGSQLGDGDRFCARCGAPLKVADEVRAGAGAAKDLATYHAMTIEFAQSNSPTFERALAFARRFASFSEGGQSKSRIFKVEFGPEQWNDTLELVEYLRGWRNRWVYVDGEKKEWAEVFYFLYCFNVRRQAYSPEHHCVEGQFKNDIHPFGCVYSGLSLVWPTSGWLQAGSFDSGLAFHFDKEKIRKIMEENLFHARFCPALDLARALEVLEAFPATANPARDQRWDYDLYPSKGAPPKPGVPVVVRRVPGWPERGIAFGVRASSRPAAIAILAEVAKKLRKTRLPVVSLES